VFDPDLAGLFITLTLLHLGEDINSLVVSQRKKRTEKEKERKGEGKGRKQKEGRNKKGKKASPSNFLVAAIRTALIHHRQ
jgi:hypothetical protein